ncbi:HAD-IA family hydrolase [Clostridiaceae bacterium 68-1-5]|uniref:HAD-IA family hydrolase n=1 Tax=Suipraeoptans intestinalis TaxID=2606628 RepID=A0A6N7V2P4_9FIRM|nr:HAD-IA family hydrolase [Suipraeoptans intestinalis]MSR94156.1 HAD-IA family hydrolase [Suipraeoptans intestinalis]
MKREALKLVVFDMDGVILDSEPLHEGARRSMFRELGVKEDESLPNPVGTSASAFWGEVIRRNGIKGFDGDMLEKKQYDWVIQKIIHNRLSATEGLLDVIKGLKREGIPIALASSSSRDLVNEVLKYLAIEEFFDITITGDEVKNRKPDPEIYLKVLEKAGVCAENTIAVEDTVSGVGAATAAGIYCFGYRNATSGAQDLSKADRIIERMEEITEWLKI